VPSFGHAPSAPQPSTLAVVLPSSRRSVAHPKLGVFGKAQSFADGRRRGDRCGRSAAPLIEDTLGWILLVQAEANKALADQTLRSDRHDEQLRMQAMALRSTAAQLSRTIADVAKAGPNPNGGNPGNPGNGNGG
jgi:hypothetical protein